MNKELENIFISVSVHRLNVHEIFLLKETLNLDNKMIVSSVIFQTEIGEIEDYFVQPKGVVVRNNLTGFYLN